MRVVAGGAVWWRGPQQPVGDGGVGDGVGAVPSQDEEAVEPGDATHQLLPRHLAGTARSGQRRGRGEPVRRYDYTPHLSGSDLRRTVPSTDDCRTYGRRRQGKSRYFYKNRPGDDVH